jgi:protein tyrosine phosphatase (PTP) superfamily phosphohydrolase (DUF442 family)
MKIITTVFIACFLLSLSNIAKALSNGDKVIFSTQKELEDLKNLQFDQNNMISAGLPNKVHFESLKAMGLSLVIDLIPGDRSKEAALLNSMEIPYNNIAVDWGNPTLQNFTDYVKYMEEAQQTDGLVLTHCKLNWRGAVFTYLYRVTQLKHDESSARAHMLDTWEPNQRWQSFIDEVKTHYEL